jgi:dihydroflavonol-4-reductase
LLIELSQLDNFIYATKRKEANLNTVKELFAHYQKEAFFDKISWIEFDLQNPETFKNIPTTISEIYHTAAFVSFLPKYEKTMYAINVEGTKNLLEWSKNNTVITFAFVSSIAAIGKAKKGELIDENTLYNTSEHHSAYAETKYQAEQLVWTYKDYFKVVAINPGVIIGPTDWDKSSGALFKVGYKGMKFYTLGVNGFVDVRDVARGLVVIVQNIKDTHGNRFIAVGENANYKQLFTAIAHSLNKPSPKILAIPLFTEIGWRLEKIKSIITSKPANLTKETARSAQEVHRFDNSRLDTLIGKFIPMEEAVKNAAAFIRKKYGV